MKKIFLSFALLIITVTVFCQHPIGNDSLALQTLGNSKTLVKSKGAIGSDSGFVNAVYLDTASANLGKLKNYPGAQIRVVDTIFVRNSTATKWLNISVSTGGGSGVTSVAKGWGILQDGTITTTGTITLDSVLLDERYANGDINFIVDFGVLDSLNAPPGSPSEGDKYLVGTVATGDFAGEENNIAAYTGGTWAGNFQTPSSGQLLINANNGIISKWTGTAWIRVSRYKISLGGDAVGVPLNIGTIDNKGLTFKTNNINRLSITNNGAYTFNNLTGTGTRIAQLSSTGGLSAIVNGDDGQILTLDSGEPIWADAGAASRFGVSGEDDLFTASRYVDFDYNVMNWANVLSFNALASDNPPDGIASGINFMSTSFGDTSQARIITVSSSDLSQVYTNIYSVNFDNNNGVYKILTAPVTYSSGGFDAMVRNQTTGHIELTTISGGSGVTTLAAIGASPNANAATISGVTLNLEPASDLFGGVVTTGTQIFGGNKTLNGTLTLPGVTIGSSLDSFLTIRDFLVHKMPVQTLSPWARGPLPSASATLNVIYPRTQTDSVFVGITGDLLVNAPQALFNVNGTARFSGFVSTGGALETGNTIVSGNRLTLGGITDNALYNFQLPAPGTGTNNDAHSIHMVQNYGSTSVTGVVGVFIGHNLVNLGPTNMDFTAYVNAASPTSTGTVGYLTGFRNEHVFATNNNANNITKVTGFINKTSGSVGGTHKIDEYVAFQDSVFAGSVAKISGTYFSVKLDSISSDIYAGSTGGAYHFWERANAANTIKNRFEAATNEFPNLPDGTPGTDSLVVKSGGVLKAISPTYYGAGGGATTFAALTDVNLTSLATNDFIKWDGTDWINRTPTNVRTDLGLVIGTNVQAYDADLTTYAGITPSANVQTLLAAADYAAFKTSLLLNSVENTAISTWPGSANITTLGTIATGVWNGTAISIAKGGTGKTSIGTDKFLYSDNGTSFSEATFKQGSAITYTSGVTGTITWTGTTAPSGTETHTYRWTQVGNIVFFRFNLKYSVAGTALTIVTLTLPADMPTPAEPAGFGSADNNMSLGTGGFAASPSGAVANNGKCSITVNSGDTGYILAIASGSNNSGVAYASGFYFVP